MSLSDLELLQLVETAKEKQRGPKGEPGVGIDRIEQYDGESFTIKLTDGNYKKITLQPGRDGKAGEPGPIGHAASKALTGAQDERARQEQADRMAYLAYLARQ